MIALIFLLDKIIYLYGLVLFVYVVLSWLTAFNVVNPRHQIVLAIRRVTSALVDPVLVPIRKIVPLISGIDLSPVVLILILYFLDIFLMQDVLRHFA